MAAMPENFANEVEEEVDDGPADYSGYLLAAAKRGNVASMRETLDEHLEECNLNVQDGVGNSPLHYSATWGHLDTLQMMLDAGTDPNLKNFQGETALHIAFYKDELDMVRLLVQRGADPRVVNHAGMKPGDYAQSPEAREFNDKLMAETKTGLVRLAPKPPDRSSKYAAAAAAGPQKELDMSQLPGMAADENDVDED